MLKNNPQKAAAIANKLSGASSLSMKLDASISYSSSPAVSGLETCLSDLSGIVQNFSANLSTDSANLVKLATTLQRTDEKVAGR
ncbi:DUF3130 family protein [Enterococcus sp. LJL128]